MVWGLKSCLAVSLLGQAGHFCSAHIGQKVDPKCYLFIGYSSWSLTPHGALSGSETPGELVPEPEVYLDRLIKFLAVSNRSFDKSSHPPGRVVVLPLWCIRFENRALGILLVSPARRAPPKQSPIS